MPEILTQDEIDSLLTAIESGVAATEIQVQRKVKIYDLKRPDLLNQAKKEELGSIANDFSAFVQAHLASELGFPCVVNVTSISTMSFEELFRSTPSFAPLSSIDWNETCENPISLQIDPVLAFTIIDKLTGGANVIHGVAATDQKRMITSFEKRILHKIFSDLIVLLERAITRAGVAIDLQIHSVGCFQDSFHVGQPEELAEVISLEVKIRNIEKMINLALPRKLIRYIWPLVSANRIQHDTLKKEEPAFCITETNVQNVTYQTLKRLKSGNRLLLKPDSVRRKFGVV